MEFPRLARAALFPGRKWPHNTATVALHNNVVIDGTIIFDPVLQKDHGPKKKKS
jgi:hypothetical protein